jgi:hypothetical protein
MGNKKPALRRVENFTELFFMHFSIAVAISYIDQCWQLNASDYAKQGRLHVCLEMNIMRK